MHAQTPKKGAGSHNRSTPKAMAHLQAAINRESTCACILHKTAPGQGTVLSNTRFNRQGDGIQSMCRDGKTLIDSLKHQFWRLIHAILLDAIAQQRFDTPTWESACTLPTLTKQARTIIARTRQHPDVVVFETSLSNATTTLEQYLRAAKSLETALTLKNLGAYTQYHIDEQQAASQWDALNTALKNITAIARFQERDPHLQHLLENSEITYWVQESATQSQFHPAATMTRNWSKMNTLYQKLPDGKYAPAGLRGPFHNTKIANQANSGGDRLVRYLTEMPFNEGPRDVDLHITRNRQKHQHADHIIPLSLGGRHTIANLAFIPAQENLDKRDTLTYEGYAHIFSGHGFLLINGDAFLVLRAFFERIGTDPALFAQERPHIEGALRQTMQTRIQAFRAASPIEKRALLTRYRPDLNDTQHTLFLQRFDRKHNAL